MKGGLNKKVKVCDFSSSSTSHKSV